MDTDGIGDGPREQTAGDQESLQTEALHKRTEARKHKAEWKLDLREAYFFAAPHRCRSMDSHERVSLKPKDAGEVNISLAAELTTDFATLVMNTYMPEAEPWCSRKPSYKVPPAVRAQVKKLLDDQDERIFEAIGASNFYSECTKAFIPDLALGTTSLWIDKIHPADPIHCQAVPIHELDGCLSAFGHHDIIFHSKHYRYDELSVVLPGVKLDAESQRMAKEKGSERVEVTRGFWRDWEDKGDVCYVYIVLLKDILVADKTLRGAGSCPLIVGRFNPMAEWFWANGPLLQALPDFRALDELTLKKFMSIDLTLMPPFSYPDDSFVNLEEGVEAGMGYAIRPGGGVDIKNLYDARPQNAAIYQTNEFVQGIKRLFFLDFPLQTGDTPPSATQWTDEVEKAERRIGTPGRPFWKEFCAPVFLRFAYLLEKEGVNTPVEVDGKSVACVPVNPAEIAAQAQDVAAFAKFAQIGGMVAPEEFKMWTDGLETLKALAEKLAANKIWKLRPPDQVAGAIQQMKQLLPGQQPGAPQVGGPGVEAPQNAGGAANKPAELMSRGP